MFNLQKKSPYSIKGKEGVIDDVIHQNKEWRVRVNGVYWSARAHRELRLQPGDAFRVIGRESIKLLIEPL